MLAITVVCIISIVIFIYEIRLRKARKVISELRFDNWTKACCLDAMFALNDSLIRRLEAKE